MITGLLLIVPGEILGLATTKSRPLSSQKLSAITCCWIFFPTWERRTFKVGPADHSSRLVHVGTIAWIEFWRAVGRHVHPQLRTYTFTLKCCRFARIHYYITFGQGTARLNFGTSRCPAFLDHNIDIIQCLAEPRKIKFSILYAALPFSITV